MIINEEEIINYDGQGWPICKMNLRSIIEALGGVYNEDTNKWEIPESEKLDVYPTRLIDDGMGYGVDEQYIVEVSLLNGSNNTPRCYIFTEPELKDMDIWREVGVYPCYTFEHEGIEYTISSISPSSDGVVKCFFVCHYIDEEEKNFIKLFSIDELKEILKNGRNKIYI